MASKRHEIVVYDAQSACPYLPGETSRLPLRLPLAGLGPEELDARLAAGERRSGSFMYAPACPTCQACEPLRIDATEFRLSRSQQRIWKRGEKLFTTEIGEPKVDAAHVALFNRHRNLRGLAHDGCDVDDSDYQQFLVDTCCDTREIAYYLERRLAMVAIIDCGATALSAVYTYFDPDLERYSPGVYSVLKQLELCRLWNKRYLYLGFYIAASEHMSYKARYVPHERRIAGNWRRTASQPDSE